MCKVWCMSSWTHGPFSSTSHVDAYLSYDDNGETVFDWFSIAAKSYYDLVLR